MQDKKLWFVIQGPMNFFDDVKNYIRIKNLIRSKYELQEFGNCKCIIHTL